MSAKILQTTSLSYSNATLQKLDSDSHYSIGGDIHYFLNHYKVVKLICSDLHYKL